MSMQSLDGSFNRDIFIFSVMACFSLEILGILILGSKEEEDTGRMQFTAGISMHTTTPGHTIPYRQVEIQKMLKIK